MKYKKEKFKYLGKQNNLLSHPDNSVLDKHPNPHLNTKYCIRFTCPEFTSICPVTSQPDFAGWTEEKLILLPVPDNLV